jgi:hypothetical protein
MAASRSPTAQSKLVAQPGHVRVAPTGRHRHGRQGANAGVARCLRVGSQRGGRRGSPRPGLAACGRLSRRGPQPHDCGRANHVWTSGLRNLPAAPPSTRPGTSPWVAPPHAEPSLEVSALLTSSMDRADLLAPAAAGGLRGGGPDGDAGAGDAGHLQLLALCSSSVSTGRPRRPVDGRR